MTKKKTTKKAVKKARKVGRPDLLSNEDAVRKLQYAFSIGCNTTEACQHAEVSRDSFYAAKKKNKEFSDRIERLKLNPYMKALHTTYTDLGNIETAKWWLERKKRGEFGPKQDIKIDANVETAAPMDEKELLKIMAEKKANEKESAKGSAK